MGGLTMETQRTQMWLDKKSLEILQDVLETQECKLNHGLTANTKEHALTSKILARVRSALSKMDGG